MKSRFIISLLLVSAFAGCDLTGQYQGRIDDAGRRGGAAPQPQVPAGQVPAGQAQPAPANNAAVPAPANNAPAGAAAPANGS